MARYSFNGTVLHELPVSSGHQVILKRKLDGVDYYFLVVYGSAYISIDGAICVPSGASAAAYATTADAHRWVAASQGTDVEEPYCAVAYSGEYIWTNGDIRAVNVEQDDEGNVTDIVDAGLAYAGSVPVWAAPDVPVGSFGWNTGGSTASLSQSNVTIPQMAAGSGWHSQLELHCISSVGDGGEIKTEWFCNGSLVDWGTAAGGSAHSVLKPSAEAVGEFQYYARVTNTLNGASTSENTPTIKVTVVSYNFDQFDPDTGDSTGTLTPGIVVPDDDPGGDSGGDSGGTGGDDPGTGAGRFDLRSWLVGFVLGLAGKPLPAGNGGGGNG